MNRIRLFLLTLVFICFFRGSSPAQEECQKWIDEVIQLKNQRCDLSGGANPMMYPAYYEPKDMSDGEKTEFLLNGLMKQKSLARKLACLKALVERFPLTTRKKIQSIAENGALDREVRKRAIWVTGLMRLPGSHVWLEKLMNNMEPVIRESAIDAMGLILYPHYTQKFTAPRYLQPTGTSIHGPIPIFVDTLFRMNFADIQALESMTNRAAAMQLHRTGISANSKLKPVADEKAKKRITDRLVKTMTHGRTQGERIAAARALGSYQPKDYKLRVAEWGVWVQSNGKLQLVKSVLDEIPPIAYQTTKQIVELKKRVNQIMIVTKPIIHVTVNQPMSINVTAYIRQGQPWYSYPQPNDFALDVGGSNHQQSEVSDNDFLDLRKTQKTVSTKWKSFGKQAHDGYPFLYPKSSMVGGYGGRGFGSMNLLQAIGVQWQHLIVSPKLESWMIEQTVDPKYEWWSRLRDVKSSWVSNGFESEKFLYYDGPTRLPSPLFVDPSSKQPKANYVGVLVNQPKSVDVANQLMKPLGLIVRVSGGKVAGRKVDFDYTNSLAQNVKDLKKKLSVDLTGLQSNRALNEKFDLDRDAVLREFIAMIKIKNGLNSDEAQGLFQAWNKQFFETDGTRLIVRMRRQDYDYQCPLAISPTPTETSRVGLILTELE